MAGDRVSKWVLRGLMWFFGIWSWVERWFYERRVYGSVVVIMSALCPPKAPSSPEAPFERRRYSCGRKWMKRWFRGPDRCLEIVVLAEDIGHEQLMLDRLMVTNRIALECVVTSVLIDGAEVIGSEIPATMFDATFIGVRLGTPPFRRLVVRLRRRLGG